MRSFRLLLVVSALLLACSNGTPVKTDDTVHCTEEPNSITVWMHEEGSFTLVDDKQWLERDDTGRPLDRYTEVRRSTAPKKEVLLFQKEKERFVWLQEGQCGSHYTSSDTTAFTFLYKGDFVSVANCT